MKDDDYRTPSGRSAPYPDMSDDDLDDFEGWSREMDSNMPWYGWVIAGVIISSILGTIVAVVITLIQWGYST